MHKRVIHNGKLSYSTFNFQNTHTEILQRPHSSCTNKVASLINRGQSRQSILLFNQLQNKGTKPTDFLLSTVLKGCGNLEALQQGKQIHCMILKHGFNVDMIVMTSLVDMYSKCTCIEESRRVFDEMTEKDVIAMNTMVSGLCRCGLTMEAMGLFRNMSNRDIGSWNSLISGLVRNSEGVGALVLFREMQVEGVKANFLTMVSVLSVCADLAALVNGKQVHGMVIIHGFEMYRPIGNATLDMYAKCGCMDEASLCFGNIVSKNVISWTSLIIGFGKNGLGDEALKAFGQMEMEGVVPNKITFLGVLYACSHAGLVQEGLKHFNIMINTYCFTPMMEHYTCMVDLLARSGYLEQALEFIEKKMPVKPDAKLLTALLSSCYFHKNVELAKSVGKRLLELEPREAGAYMLLSNFYGQMGDLEGVAQVRRSMMNRGIRKEKACTWIEIDRRVHAFESGDRSHPLHRYIHNYLEVLIRKMKANGYVPNTSLVVQNVDEQTKEEMLLGHSEKLAIGLGLICTSPGARITIVKNLRVCVDCHSATMFISKIEGREIVARDLNRFHRFKDGVCSCGNHW